MIDGFEPVFYMVREQKVNNKCQTVELLIKKKQKN